MDRWASNSLRVLGIVITSIVLILGSLLLFLLTLCAWGGGFGGGGGQKDQAVGFALALFVLIAAGIFVIARLGKGIARSSALQAQTNPSLDASQGRVPLHISPASQQAIQNLIYAIVALIGVSLLSTLWNLRLMRSNPYEHLSPFPAILSFLAYQVPYAVLIIFLIKKPDKRTLAFTLAIAVVSMVQTLYTIPMMIPYFRLNAHSLGLLLVFFALDGLILWFAWPASQRLGLRHDPASLVVAVIVAFLYLGFIRHFATPWLYRFLWR
jgi:hypothetical protein